MEALEPNPRTMVYFRDPPIARFLFADTRGAWLWVPLRLYVAYVWLTSFWNKVNNPGWYETGEALKGFWTKALQDNDPGIYFDWYRAFLQFLVDIQAWTWFSKLIIAGELLVGLSVLLGAFIGIGAFGGVFMNLNYLLAGSVSSNPILVLLQILFIMGWKVAGWIGLDRYLLPLLGTPWAPAREMQAELPPAEKQPLTRPV